MYTKLNVIFQMNTYFFVNSAFYNEELRIQL